MSKICSASSSGQVLQGRRILSAKYRVPPSRLDAVAGYYRDRFGMQMSSSGSSGTNVVTQLAFPHSVNSCNLQFRTISSSTGASTTSSSAACASSSASPPPAASSSKPLYWKIGLAVDDVNACLGRMGSGDRGSQFLDVGFLEHVQDPIGHPVELLQTTFEGNEAGKRIIQASRDPQATSPNALTGGPDPVIGQITTRTRDPTALVKFYTEVMGMTLLEKQDVSRYGFDLYFFAYCDAPSAQLQASIQARREWLYQLPVTTLEVQHHRGTDPKGPRLKGPDDIPASAAAFEGISVGVSAADFRRISNHATFDAKTNTVIDPDGLRIDVIVLGQDGKVASNCTNTLLPARLNVPQVVGHQDENQLSVPGSPRAGSHSPRMRSPRISAFLQPSMAPHPVSPALEGSDWSRVFGQGPMPSSPRLGAHTRAQYAAMSSSSSGANKGASTSSGTSNKSSGGRADWSVVVTREIDPLHKFPGAPQLKLLQFPCLDDNYGYLFHLPGGGAGRVIAVDLPQGCGAEYCERARETFGSPITDVLVTHWHWDHLGAWPEIKANNFALNSGVRPRMFGSRVELPNLQRYASESDFDDLLKQGDKLTIGAGGGSSVSGGGQTATTPLEFEIIHVPGHTLGHIAFYLKSHGLAFTGDIIFPMGCGRVFEGDAAAGP
ncbi:unnamed protein product [Amoebophrya sp. A25]|nr:unnamed protein product [Amoebophrya sp. A25]|eukprot:GSA25T00021094001.1